MVVRVATLICLITNLPNPEVAAKVAVDDGRAPKPLATASIDSEQVVAIKVVVARIREEEVIQANLRCRVSPLAV